MRNGDQQREKDQAVRNQPKDSQKSFLPKDLKIAHHQCQPNLAQSQALSAGLG